jgi:p-hydroxybenzoate 3-monooxygenase
LRTQVGIVGAGPAGLLLSHLLALEGIDTVVLEDRTRAYVEGRIRAGLLEQGTVDMLNDAGVGARLRREGLVHNGIELRFGGRGHRIDLAGLAGRPVTIYGQHEVVKDMIAVRLEKGLPIVFEVEDVNFLDLETPRPRIRYRSEGQDREIKADLIAGCDGFHGICRPTIPQGVLEVFDRAYPFGWLGILVDAPPAHDELIYASHERGFALFTMRSPKISRLYLQCAPDEDLDLWPDERIWEELLLRLSGEDGWKPNIGPILQKGVTGMRSFLVEPMQYGNLFLAGDAAHIVPPTGAKGMNLAVADVRALARAMTAFFKTGRRELLEAYSATCLKRVWRAEHFSWWMTQMLHKSPVADAFDQRMQRAQLEYVVSSRAASQSLAENYAGLPWDWDQS